MALASGGAMQLRHRPAAETFLSAAQRAPLHSAGSGQAATRSCEAWRQHALGLSASAVAHPRYERAGRARRIPARCSQSSGAVPAGIQTAKKQCLRCGETYAQEDNSPVACNYHGHMTGDKGMYSYAPPHQGVDGDWSESSGVIVYVWSQEGERPNTGRKNWKKRWTCCGVYEEHAPPCRKGWHASYDDGATRF